MMPFAFVSAATVISSASVEVRPRWLTSSLNFSCESPRPGTSFQLPNRAWKSSDAPPPPLFCAASALASQSAACGPSGPLQRVQHVLKCMKGGLPQPLEQPPASMLPEDASAPAFLTEGCESPLRSIIPPASPRADDVRMIRPGLNAGGAFAASFVAGAGVPFSVLSIFSMQSRACGPSGPLQCVQHVEKRPNCRRPHPLSHLA
mmetsp:Transcript_87085/g.224292  ORF Transcript_87085/g.224292 Transcript_87085/m.224292 type:complete len:204 (-) Transcript_87085:980-1591(-)